MIEKINRNSDGVFSFGEKRQN
uniref:Uncharacterized protein n=1 Tax=Anguilla anguilla TaxID=7936 RepID=A0A0E9WCP0_ANGAN